MHRKTLALSLALAVAIMIAVFCGVWLYRSEKSLAEANRLLDDARAQIQTCMTKSESYYSELQLKTASLNEANDQLTSTKNDLNSLGSLYSSVSSRLSSTESQLQKATGELEKARADLQLYKDTWGTVVASSVRPPFQRADIVSQPTASNPTWVQVQSFILLDKTDEKPYLTDTYTCGDFARDVHNNAEKAGIRTAYVAIKFSEFWHACNAFKTTDRGLVFVDCTGVPGAGPTHRDKTVNVKLGTDYIPMSMFPEPGWMTMWQNMGEVLDVQIYW